MPKIEKTFFDIVSEGIARKHNEADAQLLPPSQSFVSVLTDVALLDEAQLELGKEHDATPVLCGPKEFEALHAATFHNRNMLNGWANEFGLGKAVSLARIALVQALADLPNPSVPVIEDAASADVEELAASS